MFVVMGGIRRHKKRQFKAGVKKDPRVPREQWPHNGYKDIVRENEKFVEFYRAQNMCDSEEELQLMIKSFQKDLPASFRVTGVRSQVGRRKKVKNQT